ncbi:MAG: hypothetical protein B6229_10910 [Spirochaetaceae bacterium 4572_7]|nr:MAG: hypothetical protein B6229_10910 [Spirochaetaceae bacterium 4572_7]
MKKDSEKNIVRRIIFIIFTIFIGVSFFLNFTPGEVIAGNFASYALNMLKNSTEKVLDIPLFWHF